jgi:hypothetical protein
MAKCAEKCAKVHGAQAEHLHGMAKAHDEEESEKAVKEARADNSDAPLVKTLSIDDQVAAEIEKQRNSPEHQNAIKAIATKRLQAEVDQRKAEVDAELEKMKDATIAPDGVKLTGAGAPAIKAVPRGEEKEVLAVRKTHGNFAGL